MHGVNYQNETGDVRQSDVNDLAVHLILHTDKHALTEKHIKHMEEK